MPTGKVKWYDAEKGFGFLTSDEGPDVHVRADALPEGLESLKAGARVEFDLVQGRRGDSALHVRVLEAPARAQVATPARNRKDPETMVLIVEDLIKMLDDLESGYREGRHPDRKHATAVAQLLRALSSELAG
jgi:CspA family cold shock protein